MPWDNWAQSQYGGMQAPGQLGTGSYEMGTGMASPFLATQPLQAPYATPFGADSMLSLGGVSPAALKDESIWNSFLSKEGKQGWGTPALGAIGGITNAFMGMKQYGLAKKTFDESKRQFELNYGAQRDLTNNQLEDRQRARVASNGNYQSVAAYMDKNRVK